METPVVLEGNKPMRDERGRIMPGYSGNPNGRPKGKSLKEYQSEKFRMMSDSEKEQWLLDNKISGEIQWRMAEGNPQSNTDLTTGGEKITKPPEYDLEQLAKGVEEELKRLKL